MRPANLVPVEAVEKELRPPLIDDDRKSEATVDDGVIENGKLLLEDCLNVVTQNQTRPLTARPRPQVRGRGIVPEPEFNLKQKWLYLNLKSTLSSFCIKEAIKEMG